jgi:hypothetical protein
MTDAHVAQPDPDARTYAIRIQGHLGKEWADWFGGLSITRNDHGETLLTGPMDQATLYGVLKKVRDLGMPLLAVSPVNTCGSSGCFTQGAKR